LQVAGRAGRAGQASRVLVQTRFPHHALFATLARADFSAFADAQLAERRAARMPPFVFQALLAAQSKRLADALAFLADAKRAAPPAGDVRLYDPVPMTLTRLAGDERAQMLVESDRRMSLQAFLREWIGALRAHSTRIRWHIEVDPQQI
jgi:primosomal protein N' (replication factor Y)